jgi:hypothetical protein
MMLPFSKPLLYAAIAVVLDRKYRRNARKSRTQHTLQSNVNCAVKSSAVSKVTESRNFNCTNVRNFQHTLDLTAQLLAVQLKLKVKLYVCWANYAVSIATKV